MLLSMMLCKGIRLDNWNSTPRVCADVLAKKGYNWKMEIEATVVYEMLSLRKKVATLKTYL